MTKLTRYTEEMRGFSGKHRLTFDNASFRESVLTWHRDLSTLMVRRLLCMRRVVFSLSLG